MAQNSIYVADVSVFTINIISNDLSIFRKSLILCYLQDYYIYHILYVLSSDTHLALVLHFTLLYFCMLYIFVKTIVDFGIFYLEICISLFLFFFLQNALSLPFSLDFYQKFTTFTRIAYFSQTCTFIRNMQFSQSLIFWIF